MPSTKPIALTGLTLFALGYMGMLGPFGTDAYLPALPAMAIDLKVLPSHIQVTLSAFTIGMAIGQFILGALSDRLGRKVVLVAGGILVMLGAIGAALAPNAEVLIALCFFMGLTAAAGIVNGRAVVADLTHGPAAARPFSILGMTVSIGPIIGPIGGTLLLGVGGWRAIFVGLAIFAATATLAIAFFVPESLPAEKRHSGGFSTTWGNARRILVNRPYLTYAVVIWFGFGMMFAYISSSSFIVQENLNMSATAYATVFGVNGIGIIITSFITARLVKTVAPKKLLLVGVGMQVVAALGLIVIVSANVVTVWTVLPALFILGTAMGFIFGPATAMAMVEVRFASGTALALMGSMQFVAASISATIVGFISSDALVALTIVATGAVTLVVSAVVVGTVSGRRAQSASAR